MYNKYINKHYISVKFVVWLTLRRTNEPVCPFGSLFSMLCRTAHLGAAAEGQTRAWVPSLPVTFFLWEDAHVVLVNDVDDEPAVGESPVIQTAVGRSIPSVALSSLRFPSQTDSCLSSMKPPDSCLPNALPRGRTISQLNKRLNGTSTGLSRFTSLFSSLQREGGRQCS